jgi:phosphoglycerate dehydrogenase-like enzyme
MKPSACLINVARGGLVDEHALYAALAEGRLAGAGLDVFSTEPMKPDSPLLKLPSVIATPHIAGTTNGTSRRRAGCAAQNIDRIAAGLEPLYLVDGQNPPASASRDSSSEPTSESDLVIGHYPPR